MRRAVVLVVAVLGSILLVVPATAQTPGGGPPPSGSDGSPLPLPPPSSATTSAGPPRDLTVDDSAAADEAATAGVVIVAEKVAVVDLLGAGAFAGGQPGLPPPLAPVVDVVVDRTDLAELDRDQLLSQLDVLQLDGEDVLVALEDEGIPVSREVIEALEGPTDEQWTAIEADQSAAVLLGPYLTALDDLELRNGRAGTDDSPRLRDGELLATGVRAAYGELDGEPPVDEPTTTAPPEVQPAPEAVEPATDDDRGVPWLLWLLAALVVAALAVSAVLALRRRRSTVVGAQFDELLDVSRRLAAARTPADVEQIGAQEAARLLGGTDRTTGAVIHRGPGGLELGHETRDGVLVPDQLGEGLLRRVVETGQPVHAVVDTEPAIRHLPAALVAVPVIGDGRVNAVAVAVRNPDRPFTAAEVELLGKLGPITAAALESARHADDATSASLTDALTGVGNRRRLEQDLPALLLGATGPTAVVMVDLDHFKAVNDEHGHPAGDALLRQVAEALRGVLRPGDGVYRYGGEEFAMVLSGATAEAAAEVAERARQALRTASYDLGDGVVHRATASLGVAATDGADDLDGLGLIARADRALYRAKDAGRDRVEVASEPAGG